MEQHVQQIIEGVSNSYGQDFFEKLSLNLDQVIGADYTFIARIDKDKNTATTITYVEHKKIANNLVYSLNDTPCANVADNNVCCIANDICSLFPKDQFLVTLKIEGYIGTPLYDSKGNVMGIIVALYNKPITNEQTALTLFRIFSGRVAAEMERLDYEKSLKSLNDNLDLKVVQRTADLSDAVNQLKLTQKKLVEIDKMAALGSLVAGVAHEVNTPLGLAITTHSVMELEFNRLNKKVSNDQLSLQDMDQYLVKIREALTLQSENLQRAKSLIENFKRIAVEQHYLEVETVNIVDYYQQVLTTLQPLCRAKNVQVNLSENNDLSIKTLPGLHAQIITNLVNNSINHGFDGESNNEITIEVKSISSQEVEVHFIDNGIGVSDDTAQHLFEPFYTTAREQGGSGLGLSIVYNIIVQQLHGDIAIKPSATGLHLIYHFKADSSTQREVQLPLAITT